MPLKYFDSLSVGISSLCCFRCSVIVFFVETRIGAFSQVPG